MTEAECERALTPMLESMTNETLEDAALWVDATASTRALDSKVLSLLVPTTRVLHLIARGNGTLSNANLTSALWSTCLAIFQLGYQTAQRQINGKCTRAKKKGDNHGTRTAHKK